MKYSLAFLLAAATVISVASAVGSGPRSSSKREQLRTAERDRKLEEAAVKHSLLRQRIRANLGLEPSTALVLGEEAPMTHEEYKDAILSFHAFDQVNFESFLKNAGVPLGLNGGLRAAIKHEGVYNQCLAALKKYVSEEGTSTS